MGNGHQTRVAEAPPQYAPNTLANKLGQGVPPPRRMHPPSYCRRRPATLSPRRRGTKTEPHHRHPG